jgi:hypothetical protein
MVNAKPPQERSTANFDNNPTQAIDVVQLLHAAERALRHQVESRVFVHELEREAEAEAISAETWQVLNLQEPDANRRAGLWLIGRNFFDEGAGSGDPVEGAVAMRDWITAMLAPREPHP